MTTLIWTLGAALGVAVLVIVFLVRQNYTLWQRATHWETQHYTLMLAMENLLEGVRRHRHLSAELDALAARFDG